jgi:hypothetical protein
VSGKLSLIERRPSAPLLRRALPLALALLLLACFAGRATAAETSWEFEYTGEPQPFEVPAGVTQLWISASGAAGGVSDGGLGGLPGGAGGIAYGRFAVHPGETLMILVGGEGEARLGEFANAWGYGCGGAAGADGFPNPTHSSGGGGGGSTAVLRGFFRWSERDCTTPRTESGLLLVGGGGGGGSDGGIVPNANHVALPDPGVPGGDGGSPPAEGRGDLRGGLPGCGGCQSGPAGAAGEGVNPGLGGSGGGGGGYRGGGGGRSGSGGGGSSYVAAGAKDPGFLPGSGSGAGSVYISSLPTEDFACTGQEQEAEVPRGAALMEAEAIGGAGVAKGPNLHIPGGSGGGATGVFEVHPGGLFNVWVGCAGAGSKGGWGYGNGGDGGGPSEQAEHGGGGGGSSAVARVEGARPLVLGAGGAGAGGVGGNLFEGIVDGTPGGAGGEGGNEPTSGANGEDGGGDGGASASVGNQVGENGHEARDLSQDGGGGGGGSGWYSGAGGHTGGFLGKGGGGGGGGLSHVSPTATTSGFFHTSLSGGGLVSLTFMPPTPTGVVVRGGSKQGAPIGGRFAEPLEAKVIGAGGERVAGAEVTFALPTSGVGGSFVEGAGTTVTAVTDEEGLAESPAIVADGIGGTWQATATVGALPPAEFSLTNEPSPTAVALVASADPVTTTEPVTFTATVSASNAAAGTPAGRVQFLDGETALGAPVELAGGKATSAPVSGLAPPGDEITARYEGTPSFQPSADTISIVVQKTETGIAVTSSENPAATAAQLRFTAHVSVPAGDAPFEGEVQFKVDDAPLGPPVKAVAGEAESVLYEALNPGNNVIKAEVLEDADYFANLGEMIEVVDPDGVAVEVSSTSNPVEYGSPFRLEVAVAPKPPLTEAPRGEIVITSPTSSSFCLGQLEEGRMACEPYPLLEPGPELLEAGYGGFPPYGAGDGSYVEQITKARTQTGVAAAPTSITYGEEAAFAAAVGRQTVGEGTPTGTVAFDLDGTAIGGPMPVAGGQADSAPTVPGGGAHTLTATYSGDSHFDGSKGKLAYIVRPDPTQVALTASAASSQPGAAVSFDATVAAPALPDGGPAPTPRGEVQFRVDGVDLGAPVALVGGAATSPPDPDLAPGHHRVVARYLPGTDDFVPAAASIAHLVEQPTNVVVASPANPSAPGAPITFAAHVGPVAAAGTVAFEVDGEAVADCAAQPLADSEATCAVAGLGAGEHEVTAAFSGTRLLDPSRGSLTQVVEPGAPSAGAATGSPAATPAAAACGLRKVRARMLVFRSRNVVRLVGRYLAAAPARVSIGFFARGAGNSRRPLGTIKRDWEREGRTRIDLHLPPSTMARLRRHGHGFVADFTVPGDPGFCAEEFERDLSLRRPVEGQSVWFQRDSDPASLPR